MSDVNAKRFIRVPGSKRRYIDTLTGIDISDYQRRAIQEAAGLTKRLDPIRRATFKRQQRDYQRAVESRLRILRDRGLDVTERAVMYDPEFKRTVKEAKKARAKYAKLKTRADKLGVPLDKMKLSEKEKEALRDYKRKTVEYLKSVGRRNGVADWVPPGFSDAYRRGTLKRKSQLPMPWKAI